jgi:hypothetical protein
VGIQILRTLENGFDVPTTEQRKRLYEILGINHARYYKSIDGVIVKNSLSIDQIQTKEDFYLVEVKTTNAKNVTELPYGVFFGLTENEESLFQSATNYRLCIVHTGMEKHYIMDFAEYERLIQNKRIQFQINFKTKKRSFEGK